MIFMRLKKDRIEKILEKFVEKDIIERDRHKRQTRKRYEIIYNITSKNIEDNLQKLFNIVVQSRRRGLNNNITYEELATSFNPDKFSNLTSWKDAFIYLKDIDQIGQKIANEFLRCTVDVFEVKGEWLKDLHVPLDIHVKKALIKTESIDLEGGKWDGEVTSVINDKPDSNPYKKIGYDDIQSQFKEVAGKYDLPRITFDELWLEHKFFLSDPLLYKESCLSNLI